MKICVWLCVSRRRRDALHEFSSVLTVWRDHADMETHNYKSNMRRPEHSFHQLYWSAGKSKDISQNNTEHRGRESTCSRLRCLGLVLCTCCVRVHVVKSTEQPAQWDQRVCYIMLMLLFESVKCAGFSIRPVSAWNHLRLQSSVCLWWTLMRFLAECVSAAASVSITHWRLPCVTSFSLRDSSATWRKWNGNEL